MSKKGVNVIKLVNRALNAIANRIVAWADYRANEQRRNLVGALVSASTEAAAYRKSLVNNHDRDSTNIGILLETISAIILQQGGGPVVLSGDLRATASACPSPRFDESEDGTMTLTIPEDGWQELTAEEGESK